MAAALELVPVTGATDDTPEDPIEASDLGLDAHADVEVLCLCALLWAPADAAARTVAALAVTDFERPIHRELFTVIARLVNSGVPHDATMVAAELERTGNLAGHHGAERSRYLANITTRGADHIALDHYTRTVVSQAYRRSFRAAARSLAQAADQLPEDQLYEHMCVLGRRQRAATERLDNLRGAGQ
ncbi:DnaB-like helicase N-terminal domain-containing protein [Rhodococcus sp. T7]|uniref:DnaB-like helicase N-terminal domain-containing protein n=1 Tax=Rhodococcus sp. T7 TaxID=627444 RepID=UPI00135980EF|nr:DnaB-like helicase N-terminal domain-containing protein [Rhodococcus sp. T7]KAF0957383.1 hypothetical protein MLGJGCBP_09215 [Rhodococcus sp. T7]KAF0962146.1 hypothetical protein MLGJGCBP_04767 [Rhodococcus sp. T7]